MAKAKGTIVIDAVKFLRKHRDQAVRVLAPELHHYLDETIQAAMWYPEADNLALLRARLQLTPGSRDEALRMMGATSARGHEKGVYSHLMEGGASRSGAFALWSSMHDTGQLTSKREDRSLRIRLTDYAHPSREMCAITEAYILETLRMGGMLPLAKKLSCAAKGESECSWHVTWESSKSEST